MADAAFAMLAGMQLDVFTPLKDGPMTARQIASAIGVKPDRLRLLPPPEELEAFLRRINVNSVAATRSLLSRCDFSFTKSLADVGCGGAGLGLVKSFPEMSITGIDLPQITPIALKLVDGEGMAERVKVITADVLKGLLPGAYDAAILRVLLQVFSPRDARLALKNIAAAINPGGLIFIVGQILDDSRTSPPEAVWFNLNFINMYDEGESYTEKEHREWLTDAGFVDIQRASYMLAGGYGLMTAGKRG